MTTAERASSWTRLWTSTRYARNSSVEIAYDTLAGSKGEPLLLVMGMAVSRFWWPTGLCQELAGRGFAVARYDQRDAGQSTRMPDTGGSNPFVALARKRGAYTSEDMTDDAIAVLDALGGGGARHGDPTGRDRRRPASADLKGPGPRDPGTGARVVRDRRIGPAGTVNRLMRRRPTVIISSPEAM